MVLVASTLLLVAASVASTSASASAGYFQRCIDNHNRIMANPERSDSKFVLLEPHNGLGNEMLAATSAFVMACVTQRALIIKFDDPLKWSLYSSPLNRVNDTDIRAARPSLPAHQGKHYKRHPTYLIYPEDVLCSDLRQNRT